MSNKLMAIFLVTIIGNTLLIAEPAIVIKKGKKIEKVNPIDESEVTKVNERAIVRDVNWKIDGKKEAKKAMLEGRSTEKPELSCH